MIDPFCSIVSAAKLAGTLEERLGYHSPVVFFPPSLEGVKSLSIHGPAVYIDGAGTWTLGVSDGFRKMDDDEVLAVKRWLCGV